LQYSAGRGAVGGFEAGGGLAEVRVGAGGPRRGGG